MIISSIDLGNVEDKAASCRKAVDACNEALKVRTYGDIPMQYALTLENAGLIYWTPAGDDNKANDCALMLRRVMNSV